MRVYVYAVYYIYIYMCVYSAFGCTVYTAQGCTIYDARRQRSGLCHATHLTLQCGHFLSRLQGGAVQLLSFEQWTLLRNHGEWMYPNHPNMFYVGVWASSTPLTAKYPSQQKWNLPCSAVWAFFPLALGSVKANTCTHLIWAAGAVISVSKTYLHIHFAQCSHLHPLWMWSFANTSGSGELSNSKYSDRGERKMGMSISNLA